MSESQRATAMTRVSRLADLGILSWLPKSPLAGAGQHTVWTATAAGTDAVQAERADALAAARQAAAAALAAVSGKTPASEPEKKPEPLQHAQVKGPVSPVANKSIATAPEPSPPENIFPEELVADAEPQPVDFAEMSALASEAEQFSAPVQAQVLELQHIGGGLWTLFWWSGGQPDARERLFAADLMHAAGAIPEGLPAPLRLEWPGAMQDMLSPGRHSLTDALSGFLAACAVSGEAVRLVSFGNSLGAELTACLSDRMELLELLSVGELIARPEQKADAWNRLANFLAR